MSYLFGDSTPFPLDENFIETLRDVTDACVALLRIDERLDDLYDRQDAARDEAGQEHARLEAVAGAVVRALEPHIGATDSVNAGQVAVRVLNAARGVLEGARADVTGRREAALRESESAIAAERDGIPRALQALLSRRALPDTVWSLRWTAGIAEAPSQAQAEGRAPCKLACTMDLDIPAASPFSRPVRVSDLERNVTLRLPAPGRLLRSRTRMVKHTLDGLFLTEVEVTPTRASMTLRRSNRHPSPGLEIVMRSDDAAAPTVRRLTETGPAAIDWVTLDAMEALGVARLWARVESLALSLERHRSHLIRATLDGRPVRELDRPAIVAERLISAVAPLVREMRRRSSASRELVLKRDLESGRREEIYIPRSDITAKYAQLTPPRRSLFDAFALAVDDASDEEPTRDFSGLIEITTEHQPPAAVA